MADVLVVVAHPDDESLFAGGAIAALADIGQRVHVVALCEGTESRGGVGALGYEAQRRASHFKRACGILGATGEIANVFPDQQADVVPQLEINRAVEKFVVVAHARTVFTHHVGDLNVDHRRTAEAVLVATRGGPQVFMMTPEYPERCVGQKWRPRFDWDITKTIDRKARACLCYVDELRDYPHPRSERAIREQTVERFMEIR
jgi:N-acetylglucosamine malate deacetylase 1